MKRAIKINAKEFKLETAYWENLKDLQKHVGGIIERVNFPKFTTLSVLVDEEGLLKDYDFGFNIEGGQEFLAGNGLIVGDNFIDFVNTDIKIEDVADYITFIGYPRKKC